MSNKQVGFTVDVNQCVSCRACEIACKVEYQRQAGQGRRRRVVERTVDESGKIRTFFISIACNHCVNPACMAACPDSTKYIGTTPHALVGGSRAGELIKAIWKDTTGEYSGGLPGVVRLDKEACIACRRCEWACPWSQPQYDPFGGGDGIPKVHKCEWCWERVKAWKDDHATEERNATIPNDTSGFDGNDVDPSDSTKDTAGNPLCDIFNPVTPKGIADKRRQSACTATCLGRTLYSMVVDPEEPVETYGTTAGANNYDNLDYKDYRGRKTGALESRKFYRSGAGSVGNPDIGDANDYSPNPGLNRGTKYLADWRLTKPALRICNKVYKTRDGEVE